ncbi:DNA-binding protein [Sulfurimonas sp. SWIR-19]|uniref:CvfB family protein n=1 Tax=Sulfurimonas sp. SWIR-19 TaxID=2878390 RepID=UPI001CF1740A|nr:S1-like domain-containing RNA-binding protein [Sulfurimonas sp. SWIR-19]UCN00559.1 DNA-binding protein [Sulfurimonas sp. SWIR-19]
MKKEISPYLELGKINTLRVDRDTTPGLYLMAEDGNDVLLPGQYVTDDMCENTLVDVFLYTDSEDRLVATTDRPLAMLDDFALLEVVDVAPFGAFMDWGLPKDLLVPKMFQKTPFEIGEKRFIRIIYDERTHRLVGTEKLGDFFDRRVKDLAQNKEAEILVISKTPLGFKCIVNGKYEGLIYHNEIFEEIKLGDKKTAYVKTVRKDGNIDLTLRRPGSKKDGNSAQKVFDILQHNKGIMPYNYKSDAGLIKDVFGLSKKEFKRSLTALQNDGKIEVKDTGIYSKAK